MNNVVIVSALGMFVTFAFNSIAQSEYAPSIDWTDIVGTLKGSQLVCIGQVTSVTSTTNTYQWKKRRVSAKVVQLNVHAVIKGNCTNVIQIVIPGTARSSEIDEDGDQLRPLQLETNTIYLLCLRGSPLNRETYELDSRDVSFPGNAAIAVTELGRVIKETESWIDKCERLVGHTDAAKEVSYWRHIETWMVIRKALGSSGRYSGETGKVLRNWWFAREEDCGVPSNTGRAVETK